MGLLILPSPSNATSHSRSRRRRRISCSIGILMAVICPLLSDIIMVSSKSYQRDSHHSFYGLQSTSRSHFLKRSYASDASLARSSSSASSPMQRPSIDRSALIFILLKGRRKNNVEQKEPAVIVDKINVIGNSENNNLMTNGEVNGNSNGHHVHYNLGDKNNGHHHDQQQQQMMVHNQLLGMNVVEDEPYATPTTTNAYNRLSKSPLNEDETRVTEPKTLEDISESSLESMDSMEGTDDKASYIRAERSLESMDPMEGTDDNAFYIRKDDEKESMWAKRNARSIDEGIRFKSQLREGLEEQSKLHREQLLSNLLEGVIGGTTSAQEKIKNATKPFRWRGFGSRGGGDTKDNASGSDDNPEGNKNRGFGFFGRNKRGSVDDTDAFAEKIDVTLDNTNMISSSSDAENDGKDKQNTRTFGARTIAGLIMAVAEEVEGLEVNVDADSQTPIWNKSVHSIKICFSRLGFRQIRMGGLDEVFSEFESTISPSEKFAMASNFFKNVGKPATADEAFDKIDIDNSGSLDEEELAQALKMAAVLGNRGNKFGMRSKEALAEMASRMVKLYDTNGDGVVDREEYREMVQDMAALRGARMKEELHEQTELDGSVEGEKKRGWISNVFGGKENSNNATSTVMDGDNEIVDVTENEEFWGSIDQGEGSIVFEDLQLDLRRLLFGAVPGVKRILPGGPLILKPFTATLTATFNNDDIMDSVFLDTSLRRLVARALSRRVRGIRDLLDGAVFYGRTWRVFEQTAPLVEVAKLENVHFDKRNRLIITGRAKITDALGYRHEPIEQGFKVRTKIGIRANGKIIGLLQPEIAIFAECPKELEKTVRTKCKEWFGYTIPTFKPAYAYIPLVSPLKKDDKMDGFNMGEDNQIKSIYIKNGKLLLEFQAFLRPGRFLGNHFLAFTVPNRTIILTLDRVKEAMRNARRNKRLAELAAREVQKLADAQQPKSGAEADIETQSNPGGKPSISPEGKARIRRLEKELKATIQEDAILREMEESSNEANGKSFIRRFVEGYSGAIREELDLEMNARLSSSISDFFGRQDSEGEDGKD